MRMGGFLEPMKNNQIFWFHDNKNWTLFMFGKKHVTSDMCNFSKIGDEDS